MTDARLGIGLVGLGRHGMRYAKHLVDGFPGARLAGFMRRDRAQAAKDADLLGAPAYPDAEGLLAAKDVDAVAVVVPPAFHLDLVRAALRHQKPVLLEKPAALNLADGKRMRQAARETGIPVMVAQTMRYNETVTAIRAQRARLGRIHALRLSQRFESSPTPWIYDPKIAGGGTMLHTGVHGFDLLRFLSGQEGVQVSAEIGTVAHGPFEDHFNAIVRLEDGAVATVSGCRATSGRTGALELVGDRGQIVADHVLRTAMFISGNTATPIPIPDPVSTIACVLEDFVRAVETGDPVPIPLDEGLRAVALVEAAYLAARNGRATRIPTLDEEGDSE
jgi:predicted dehydrogenase